MRRRPVPRDKTLQAGRMFDGTFYGGKVTTFSPPRGITWAGQFGLRIADSAVPGQTLMTAKQARTLAADLLRRADDLEDR